MYVSALYLCAVPWRPEEASDLLELETLGGSWEPKLGPLKELQGLLTPATAPGAIFKP